MPDSPKVLTLDNDRLEAEIRRRIRDTVFETISFWGKVIGLTTVVGILGSLGTTIYYIRSTVTTEAARQVKEQIPIVLADNQTKIQLEAAHKETIKAALTELKEAITLQEDIKDQITEIERALKDGSELAKSVEVLTAKLKELNSKVTDADFSKAESLLKAIHVEVTSADLLNRFDKMETSLKSLDEVVKQAGTNIKDIKAQVDSHRAVASNATLKAIVEGKSPMLSMSTNAAGETFVMIQKLHTGHDMTVGGDLVVVQNGYAKGAFHDKDKSYKPYDQR
jgi:hypothetical protein